MNDLDQLEKNLRNSISDFDAKYAFARTRLALAIQIAEEREKAGISQKELASKLNTSQSVISRIENGKQNISLDMLQKIAEALGKKQIQIVSHRKDAKYAKINNRKNILFILASNLFPYFSGYFKVFFALSASLR